MTHNTDEIGNSLFNDVKDKKLRTFNRLNTFHNLSTDFSKEIAEDYLSNFKEDEIKDMSYMALVIKTKGRKAVQDSLGVA